MCKTIIETIAGFIIGVPIGFFFVGPLGTWLWDIAWNTADAHKRPWFLGGNFWRL